MITDYRFCCNIDLLTLYWKLISEEGILQNILCSALVLYAMTVYTTTELGATLFSTFDPDTPTLRPPTSDTGLKIDFRHSPILSGVLKGKIPTNKNIVLKR